MQRALHRNSSTCVEQTCSRRSHRRPGRKHLHMRGANLAKQPIRRLGGETSPHAWSKPSVMGMYPLVFRNISTCVEQTSSLSRTLPMSWKHLHMRGANSLSQLPSKISVETSPHAWSKLRRVRDSSMQMGNISTCVEQTQKLHQYQKQFEKHLHMRGANSSVS